MWVGTYQRHRKVNPNFILLCILIALTAVNGILLLSRLVGGWLGGPDPEGVTPPDYVEEALLPVNKWSRPGTELKNVNGVVIHYVGNPDTSAEANRNYFASLSTGRENTYASAHFVVGLEGEVLQCIPLSEIAYASNDRNADTVAIEVCHPDETGEFAPETYARVVELTAWLCQTFGLDAEKDVIRHYDITGKECPRYYVLHPEAWEQFHADVAAEAERLEQQALEVEAAS